MQSIAKKNNFLIDDVGGVTEREMHTTEDTQRAERERETSERERESSSSRAEEQQQREEQKIRKKVILVFCVRAAVGRD